MSAYKYYNFLNVYSTSERPDGVLKIRYYDNSDALIIAGITE